LRDLDPSEVATLERAALILESVLERDRTPPVQREGRD